MLTRCINHYVQKTRHPVLNELDWIVVEMAKMDGPLSLNPDGFWARVSRHVLAVRVPGRLANDALEALRRFSVRAWYWNLIRTRDMRMLIDAGYSDAQAMEILAHVAARRGFSPSVEEDPD
jgi:hypothetical protein